MCGVFAYLGKKPIVPTLIAGLKKLEYRGYDSAGLAYFTDQKDITCLKKAGRISQLEKALKTLPFPPSSTLSQSCGIAHTRWATHGAPTDKNAHPHNDCKKRIFLVHNGIIENYISLKERLQKRGHRFASETDTEVLPHLIESVLSTIQGSDPGKAVGAGSLEEAVLEALKMVEGAYGLAVISAADPQKIVLARLGSPLVIGLGQGELLAASDPAALLSHTRKVIYLEDGEIATLAPDGYKISSPNRRRLKKKIAYLEWKAEAVKKGRFSTFLEKEIFEQPKALEDSLRGRLLLKEGTAKLGGLESVKDRLLNAKNIIITACGTASYAGLLGKYLFEDLAKIETTTETASEWRYRRPVFSPPTVLLAISQSGETADTLAAVKLAKKQILTLGLVNVVGSSIARETAAGVYNHVGPEISVASTKAFISQVAILALIAIFLGRQRKVLSAKRAKELTRELKNIPEKVKSVLEEAERVKRIAKKYKGAKNFLFLGRRYSFPIALEGAIKLKELSYLHAEGYPAGEMKHGPISMIDKNFPSIFIIPKDSVYEKTLSNLEEIKARGGPVLAVATKEDRRAGKLADEVIFVPPTLEPLSPILTVVPLQLFALFMASALGQNVDRPRNLAKSVTVE